MTILSTIIYIPAILLGTISVYLLWPKRVPLSASLLLSIGAGAGMGFSSILYFFSLQILPGQINMPLIHIFFVVFLGFIAYYKYHKTKLNFFTFTTLSWIQLGLLTIFIFTTIASIIVFINYVISRPQGALDAWSVWNRAARFIYRDPENWQATLSPDLPLLRHADYPLLIPLNVAWGWDALGNETLRTPMIQGAIFTFATISLIFGALSLIKTRGQASLAAVVLMTTTSIVPYGTSLIADVPLAYFILVSAVLMYLYTLKGDTSFLALSGFMAGMCGWTKNEGLIFIVAISLSLIIIDSEKLKKNWLYFFAGALLPLLVILYFKSLAPPNDLILNTTSGLLDRILEPTRYTTIFKSFFSAFLLPQALVIYIYTLVMGIYPASINRKGISSVTLLLVLQILGYGVIYLLTPYDLDWHLLTSQSRLIFQVTPLAIFIGFCVSMDPETVFSSLEIKSFSK